LSSETRWVSILAEDSSGVESPVESFAVPRDAIQPSIPQGRLFVISVGTDTYSDRRLERLTFAKSDAANFTRVAQDAAGFYYSEAKVWGLYDNRNLKSALPQRIRQAVSSATEKDTIMLFIAGHGLQDRTGRFYLATAVTLLDRLPSTALAWESIVK